MKKLTSLILLIALSLGVPFSITAQINQGENLSPDKVTIVGELKVIEKDKDGSALAMEISPLASENQDSVQHSDQSSIDQSQLVQNTSYRIAREGKGMELFHMSGGKVKITGRIQQEGNQRTLIVDEYVLMSAGDQHQQEESPKSPRPDESSNDTVRPNESSSPTESADDDDDSTKSSEESTNYYRTPAREYLQEKQPQPDQNAQQMSFFGAEYSFEQKELYRQALERKLDEWEEKCSQAEKNHEQKLDQLEETQGKVDSAKNENFQAKLDYCENLTESIRENLGKVSSQTSEGWQGFQRGVNQQLNELELAFSEMEAACKESFSFQSPSIPQQEDSQDQEDSKDIEESKTE